MTIVITPIYAAILGLFAIGLSMYVSSLRANLGISLGDAGDPALIERIRRHGNFAETVPLALILMAAGEVSGLAPAAVHLCGALLLISRIAQPMGMRHDRPYTALRLAGNIGTFIAMLIPAGYILYANFV